jgi:hypothetical protein
MARKAPMPIAASRSVDDLLRFIAAPHNSWTKAWSAWRSEPPPRDFVVLGNERDKLARCLLLMTGSPAAAHAAIARNVSVLRKPKRPVDDRVLLDKAAALQRRDKCGDNAALEKVAALRADDTDAASTIVRRLQRTLHGKTLKKFSQSRSKWLRPVL